MIRRALILSGSLLASAQGGEFQFDFAFVAGAADVAQQLTISNNLATVIHEPAFPSVEGNAIGVFRAGVTDQEQERLANLTPDRLPKPITVRPDTPSFSFRLHSGTRDVTLVVPTASVDMAEIAALQAEVTKLITRVMAKPYRALRFEVVPPTGPVRTGGVATVRIRLRNIGTQPVRMDFSDTVLRLEMARPSPPPDPNLMPKMIEWRNVAVDPWRREALRIGPGRSVEIPISVKFAEPGAWLLRAWFERRGHSDLGGTEIGGATISKATQVTVGQ